MAGISLSPKFIKEVFMLFKEKSLKELLFGKKVSLSENESALVKWIKEHPVEFTKMMGRKGVFIRIDPIHKGIGTVYILPNRISNHAQQSILVLDADTKITQGPDLWVYLSTNSDIKKEGLGEFLNLGLLKGNKGGQTYIIESSIAELSRYKSAVIWCKQFAVLFTYATLA